MALLLVGFNLGAKAQENFSATPETVFAVKQGGIYFLKAETEGSF